MRLIARRDAAIVEWDNLAYEEKCFYFNTITRKIPHRHGVRGAGLDTSYDCASEVEILRNYLQIYDGDFSTAPIQNGKLSLLSRKITKEIGGQIARQWEKRMHESVDGKSIRRLIEDDSGKESYQSERFNKRKRESDDQSERDQIPRESERFSKRRGEHDDEPELNQKSHDFGRYNKRKTERDESSDQKQRDPERIVKDESRRDRVSFGRHRDSNRSRSQDNHDVRQKRLERFGPIANSFSF